MTGSYGDHMNWPDGHEVRADGTGEGTRMRTVTSIGRLTGSSRAPGSRVIAFATWLLALLGAGLMYVSFDAQYQFILAQKDARAASLIEAAMLDAAMVILSALGIGLARAGQPSRSVRFLIVMCAASSAGMNLAAADPSSWRSVAAYVAAPVFLAVITDRVIAVIRQHVLPQDAESAWAPLGRAAVSVLRLAAVVALYLLRTVLAPSGTLQGLRQMVLDATLSPTRTGARTVCCEPTPCSADEHGIPASESERQADDQGAAQHVIRFGTKSARDPLRHQEGRFLVPLPGTPRIREPVSCRTGRRRARTAGRPAGGHQAHLHRRGTAQAHRSGRSPWRRGGRMTSPQAEPSAQALGESLAALAAQVASLRGQVALIGRRLDQAGLRGDLDLVARFEELARTVADTLDDAAPGGSAAPCWIGLDRQEYTARLAELRHWADTVLRQHYGGYELRDCWPGHIHAIWELSTLAAEWHHVYGGQRPDLTRALEFYDRWLPGTMRRIAAITQACVPECVTRRRSW